VPDPPDYAAAIVCDDIRDATGRPLGGSRLEAFVRALDHVDPPGPGRSFTAGPSRVTAVLPAGSDPLRPVLIAGLLSDAPRVRWSIAAGQPGDGLAQRAAAGIALGRARRDSLVVRTGEPGADRLLEAIAPLLADLLADLTDRQRLVARMLLVEGMRQADVADALGVSRATISVMAARGRVRAIERLAGAIRTLMAAARQAREEGGTGR
jgi:predicted XRE-type DNA-binding protein